MDDIWNQYAQLRPVMHLEWPQTSDIFTDEFQTRFVERVSSLRSCIISTGFME